MAARGVAAPIYFRRFLFKSWKNFLFMGLVPLLGAATLAWVFVKSAFDYWNPANSYSPAWFRIGGFHGVGAAFVIGIGMLVVGIPLMFWWRAARPDFFRQRSEVAETLDPGAAKGAIVSEEQLLAEEAAPSMPAVRSGPSGRSGGPGSSG